MRIGLVTGEFPPMEGGVGAFTEQLARALAASGHDVHIITSRLARPAGASRSPASLVEPLKLDSYSLHPRVRNWRWPALSVVVDAVVRQDLEIVNVQYQAAAFDMRSPAINLLPWRLKGLSKTVVTFHDLRVPYLFPKAGGLREAAVSFMARRASGVVATNEADGEALRTRTPAPVRIIPIGSNIDVYKPNHVEIAEVRDDLKVAEGDFLLGYFGFLNETKGANTLLQALSIAPPHFHLVFIGGQTGDSDRENNTEFLAKLREQIRELGLVERVHWTGFLSPTRVSSHLVAADLLVMPYRDGASLRRGTLMAALSHGRPLITTTPVAPTPELVNGENVWLVPPDEPLALTAAIQQLAADPTTRQRLQLGASVSAGHFTWDRIAKETTAFYSELLSTAGKS